MSQPLTYIHAVLESHATVECGASGLMIRRPTIGLREAGSVFATTLSIMCGLVVWMLARLDPSMPLTPLGLSIISVFCAALCGYAWVKTIDEASRHYTLFASPDGLQIRSDGLLGERNELWPCDEFSALWLMQVPKVRNNRCKQLMLKLRNSEVVSVLAHLDFDEPGVEQAIRQALGRDPAKKTDAVS